MTSMTTNIVKLLILSNGERLISQLIEVAPIDIGDPNCKLVEPFLVNEDGTLTPWLVSITNDNEFMMSSDKILTLVEPKPTLLEKYQNLLK
tara:strand:+ start:1330 stop:1602 length:273 start_codon:yes stop_codon:yes gene_type:complete